MRSLALMGSASDRDAPRPARYFRYRYGDLKEAVLELGLGLVAERSRWEWDAAEVRVVASLGLVGAIATFLCRVLPLSAHDEAVVGLLDVEVLVLDSRDLEPHDVRVAARERLICGSKVARLAPTTVPRRKPIDLVREATHEIERPPRDA